MNVSRGVSKKTFSILIIILLVAMALRLNHITQPFTDAFSWRQSSTAMMAENYFLNDWNIFFPEVNWTGPGPNYQGREFQTVSYIAALLYTVFGQHDWIGRLIAAVFGVWGIFALFQLVRLVWDEGRALAAAAMMALMPGSIFIERSFLPDPAMVALITTSFWMLIAYLRTEQTRYLLLAGIIGAWGFCTKIPGLIIGLPMAYAVFMHLRRERFSSSRIVALGGLALLMLVPVVAYYLWALHLSLSYPPFHFSGDGNWLWDEGIRRWINRIYYFPHLWRIAKDWLLTAPVMALLAAGLFYKPPAHVRENHAEQARGIFSLPWLFHWWIAAFAIYYAIGAKELITNPWNLHIVSPAVAALSGHGLVTVVSLQKRFVTSPAALLRIAVIISLILLIGQNNLKWMYKPYSRESYSLGKSLNRIAKPEDLVITMANDIGNPVAIYYSGLRGWVLPPAKPHTAWHKLPDDERELIRMLEELRAKGADWFGIVNQHIDDLRQNYPLFLNHVGNTCELNSESKDWIIYRILSPEELKSR
jgi:4-amino-4-deoxy-L-arabinose transferase-like glycosyltransferase